MMMADSEIATCVAWSSDCKLFSGSDDKIICIWNSDGECASKINTVTAFPSCISFLPQSGKQVLVSSPGLICFIIF